jgi:hypothetical protein
VSRWYVSKQEMPEYVKKIVTGLVAGLIDFDETYGKLSVSPTVKTDHALT